MGSLQIPRGRVDFERLDQVAEGIERSIYTSADFPDLVFKLQKSLHVRQTSHVGLKRFLMNNWAGFQHYNVTLENQTYLNICLTRQVDLDALPFAHIYGYVSSQAGVLQMCEKITLDGDKMGPSLKAIGEQGGFTPDDGTQLNSFIAELVRLHVPLHDMTGNNIVKGLGNDGQPRFVLIYGLGDVNVIQLRRYSAKAQRQYLVKACSRFDKNGLRFDPETFTFALL